MKKSFKLAVAAIALSGSIMLASTAQAITFISVSCGGGAPVLFADAELAQNYTLSFPAGACTRPVEVTRVAAPSNKVVTKAPVKSVK